jgi:Family of unknown function (DUF6370)
MVVIGFARWFNDDSTGAGIALYGRDGVVRFGSNTLSGGSMMRKVLLLTVAGVLFCGVGVLIAAQDDKKVTISGEGMCAKCALKETAKCQNVVIVTKDGKKENYYLVQNDVAKKAHQAEGFCQATKDDPIKVKVTGTVEKKDDKLVMTAEKIEKE